MTYNVVYVLPHLIVLTLKLPIDKSRNSMATVAVPSILLHKQHGLIVGFIIASRQKTVAGCHCFTDLYFDSGSGGGSGVPAAR